MSDARRTRRELEHRVEELEAENAALHELIETLQARIVELERKAGRNSNNSSLPPSRDDNEAREERANRAARRRAAREAKRRPGKQPGDPGKNLAQVVDPDHVVDHVPSHCGDCGASLDQAEVTGTEVRQVFDLPKRRAEVTEHRAEWRRCSCGTETGGTFPPEATAPAVWGPRVRDYGLYLMNRQLIPVERTAEILSDLLGPPVSTGFLAGLAPTAAAGLEDFSATLADRLAEADVVNVDETGSRVAGAKWWWHVASTSLLTFLGIHPKRGVEATDALGILPRFSGILVHDRWALLALQPGRTRHLQSPHPAGPGRRGRRPRPGRVGRCHVPHTPGRQGHSRGRRRGRSRRGPHRPVPVAMGSVTTPSWPRPSRPTPSREVASATPLSALPTTWPWPSMRRPTRSCCSSPISG